MVCEKRERYPAGGTTGGRSRIGLTANDHQMRALGVTIRRFDLLWGVVTFSGQLEKSWRTPIDDRRLWKDEIGQALEDIRQYIDRKEIKVVATGIGTPTFRLPWAPASDVISLIKAHVLSYSVQVGHNGSYGALAEDWFGGDDMVARCLYVFLGAGIGGAVVHRGSAKYLPRISSVEAGHVGINSQGPPCFCGNRGCVEMTASPLSLAKRAKIPGSERFAALRGIDPALKLEASQTLAYGLMSIVNTLDLETIIIGGQDALLIQDVYGAVPKLLQDHVTPSQRALIVKISTLGEWSSVIGAALGALDRLFQMAPHVSMALTNPEVMANPK